jgi:hypothetical protein
MQKDCTVLDMEPVSYSHSFEGCTAVSDPGSEAAIGHSSGDCTFVAVDIGQHTTMRRTWLAEIQDCCSGMRPASAAPVRQHAADCMWPGLGIAVAVAAAEAAAVPAGPSSLHSGLAGIDGIFLGSDWTKAAGMDRLGSKT